VELANALEKIVNGECLQHGSLNASSGSVTSLKEQRLDYAPK